MNSGAPIKVQLTKDQLEKLFDKIDLSGIKDWSKEDQGEVQKLIKDFGFLFSPNDLDLGKTFNVRNTIKLIGYSPFKEKYDRISPHQFEEVRKLYKKCWEIGAIKHSNSPWQVL